MKNKSVIMQQSDAEPSQQSFYPNLAKAGLRPTGSLGQDTVFWCSQPTKLWKPTKTMINHETTLKNHGNQPKTMKTHETTLKTHGNQPKTMRNHETTLKKHGNQPKTMNTMKLR